MTSRTPATTGQPCTERSARFGTTGQDRILPRPSALSERMCVLLEQAGTPDPLGTAYRLSNLVIGASLTAPMASDEKRVAIDPDQAPTYARLHATHHISPREILSDGITALLS